MGFQLTAILDRRQIQDSRHVQHEGGTKCHRRSLFHTTQILESALCDNPVKRMGSISGFHAQLSPPPTTNPAAYGFTSTPELVTGLASNREIRTSAPVILFKKFTVFLPREKLLHDKKSSCVKCCIWAHSSLSSQYGTVAVQSSDKGWQLNGNVTAPWAHAALQSTNGMWTYDFLQ
ncbi:hypothetical protein CBL_14084 [Carabus blaptoides fortunei]